MNIHVDCSLFCKETGALGRIHGSLKLPCVPLIGSSVSFLHPKPNFIFPVINEFSGVIKVASVLLEANCEEDGVIVLLEDILVSTKADGLALVNYFCDGFDLYFDEVDL